MKFEYGISIQVGENIWKRGNLTLDGKEGESPEDLMNRVAHTLESWFEDKGRGNMAAYGTPLSSVIESQRGRGNPIEGLVEDINSCTDIKVLDTYKLLVRGNDQLTAAYEKKLAELKK